MTGTSTATDRFQINFSFFSYFTNLANTAIFMHCGYITLQLSYLVPKQRGRAELPKVSHVFFCFFFMVLLLSYSIGTDDHDNRTTSGCRVFSVSSVSKRI